MQNVYTRRLIYGMPLLKSLDDDNVKAPVAAVAADVADFRKDVEKPNFEENTFEGKVSINNWALTRRQRIVHALSFESQTYDIYDPYFSSDDEINNR